MISSVKQVFYLLEVVRLVGQECGDVKHDLDASPVSEDGVKAREIVHGVQSSFVAVKT